MIMKSMKQNMYLAIVVILVALVIPQQTNAQFIKQLGRVVSEVGKAIIETPSNNTALNMEGVKIVTGHPDFKMVVKRCVASGENVLIDFVVTNIGESDVKEFIVRGSSDETKLYDNMGNVYNRGIQVSIGGLDFTNYSREVKLVAGVPTKFSMMVKNVPKKVTSFALIEPDICSADWNINKESVKVRNVPIYRE